MRDDKILVSRDDTSKETKPLSFQIWNQKTGIIDHLSIEVQHRRSFAIQMIRLLLWELDDE